MSVDIYRPSPYLPGGVGSGGGPRVLSGRVSTDGVRLRDSKGRALLLFVSGFTLPTLVLTNKPAADTFFDWAKMKAFNGIHIMVGALPWANQTPQDALRGLPIVLNSARDRELHVEVTALTDTASGYDYEAHLNEVSRICAPFDNVVGENANEYWHPTQAKAIHEPAELLRLGKKFWDPFDIAWSCGAPPVDEPGPEFPDLRGSKVIKVHLGRGRDLWNMVRHQREMELLAAQYKMHVWNGEPIGWDERGEAGRRCDRPEIAFAMGALSRGFSLSLTSHAQHGLRAELPGPVQDECHTQIVRGFCAYGHESDLFFMNASWAGSPVDGANFSRDDGHVGTIVRAYSFLDGANHGWTNLVGVIGDPQVRWANGFKPVGVTAEAGTLPSEGGIGKHIIIEVAR